MKKCRILCLIFALALILSACGGTGKPSKIDPNDPETVTVGVSSAPISFDMLTYGSGNAYQLVFEGLFDMNPVSGQIEPWLAESYEWLDDCTIRIKLKDDVYFSNGDKLTAEDVIYSYYRHVAPGVSSTVKGSYNIYDFDKCYAEDALTVVLTTYEPNGSLLLSMAKNPDIVCKAYYEKLDDKNLWDHTCGTGPYTVIENVSGSHCTLALREDYWNKALMPEVKTFVLKYYAEFSTMFIDFTNKALDIIIDLDDNSVKRMENGEVEGATLRKQPLYNVDYLILPESVSYFDDIRVRQAVAICVDWAVVAENAYGSLGSLATSVLPSSMTNYYKNVGAYEYNPDLARALLKEAGYADDDIVLNTLAPNMAESVRIHETIQYYLGEVGITLNFTAQELSSIMPTIAQGSGSDMFVLLCMGAPSIPEPTAVIEHANDNTMIKTCVISDLQYNAYYDAFTGSNDEAIRIEAMNNVQQWLKDNYRHIPIAERSFAYAFNKKIADVHITTAGNPELRFTELAEANASPP
jgi:peptide/nickel transport system substrate-binding protein